MIEHGYTLGIDLGGTKILAAVMDAEGQILCRVKKKTRVDLGQMMIIDRISRTVHEAIECSGIQPKKIRCIGIGAPGPINWQTGIMAEAPNLGFKDFNIKRAMEENLGITTFAFNDVNAGTWGEYVLGAGRGSSSCLGVFVGTGIGSGIIIHHKLYEGAGRFAGEIGHMCIKLHGPVCGCGRRGCLEALASRTAMTRDIWTALGQG